MHQWNSIESERFPPATLIDRHPSYSWNTKTSQFDHHPQDRIYAAEHLARGQPLQKWQYVFRALTSAASHERYMSTFIDADTLTDRDKGNLSIRRYIAEELGFGVSDFRVDHQNGVATASIRPYRPDDLPPMPSEDSNGIWRDWQRTPINRDEVDRWFSAQYLSSRRDGAGNRDLVNFYKQLAHDAISAHSVSIAAFESDPRGELSFVRRLLILSGCEVGAFYHDRDGGPLFHADVEVNDPKLAHAVDAQS